MSNLSSIVAKIGAAGALAAIVRRRRGHDPVRAAGHRHRKPPPRIKTPEAAEITPPQDQPWVRRSHSDSQKRRFRR